MMIVILKVIYLSDSSNGTHSLVDVVDITLPFEMEIDFNSDYTNMTIAVSQNGKSSVIYDVLNNGGLTEQRLICLH
jgi:hypothetical protein